MELPVFMVPGVNFSNGQWICDRITETTPLIDFNDQNGEIRIRESYRKIDDHGKPVDPPAHVSATVRLKAGQYTFQTAFDSPASKDITLTFNLVTDQKWESAEFRAERL